MIYMRGQARRLRPLAPARPHRLGLGRRAAVLQAARGSFPRRRASITRSAANGGSRSRACAGTSSTRSATAAEQAGIKRDRRFQHRRQRGLVRLPRQPEARPALVGGARLSQAGAQAAEPAAGDRLPGRRRRVRRQARRPACAGGRTARRRSARCRGEVILAAGSIGSAQILHALRRRPGRRSSRELGIPVVLDKPGVGENLQDHLQLRLIYKVVGRQDAQRDLSLAARPRARWASTTRCSGAAR